jgi:hypothetical protein
MSGRSSQFGCFDLTWNLLKLAFFTSSFTPLLIVWCSYTQEIKENTWNMLELFFFFK